MLSTTLALSALGALACAVVYGTDVFAGLVLRPALAALDDGALVQAAGRIHEYADQRMPLPGAVGTIATAGATLTAGLGDHPLQTLARRRRARRAAGVAGAVPADRRADQPPTHRRGRRA